MKSLSGWGERDAINCWTGWHRCLAGFDALGPDLKRFFGIHRFRRADTRLNSPIVHQLSSVSVSNGAPIHGRGNGNGGMTPRTFFLSQLRHYAATLGSVLAPVLTSGMARLITLLLMILTTNADDRWKNHRRNQSVTDGTSGASRTRGPFSVDVSHRVSVRVSPADRLVSDCTPAHDTSNIHIRVVHLHRDTRHFSFCVFRDPAAVRSRDHRQ